MTEDEMVGWHHQLDGHEFKQAPGDGERQGSLAWCSPWGHKELDMTEQLNKNKYLLNSQTGPGTLMAAESTRPCPQGACGLVNRCPCPFFPQLLCQ